MTLDEANYLVELEKLRLERSRVELEIQREKNRSGINLQAVLLAELARVGVEVGLPKSLPPANESLPVDPPPKLSESDWFLEIDRLLSILPPEKVDRELFEEGPMKVAEAAEYLEKSVPVVNEMWKSRQLYKLPNSKPTRICPRSVVLYKVGIPDPRLKGD